MKPGKTAKYHQPYRLIKFDETRLLYLCEEAEHQEKVERHEFGNRSHPVCSPVFVVNKKDLSYRTESWGFILFNQVTEGYYIPAPEADKALSEACVYETHSLLDCVCGFEQIDCDDETSGLCSTITPFGVFSTKKSAMGVKQ